MIENPNKPLALLVSLPAAGHYIPLLRLAEALTQDFQVVFACSQYELPKLTELSPNIPTLGLKDQNKDLSMSAIKLIPFVYFKDEWYPQLLSYMKSRKPKVVVADFFSEPAMRLAFQLGITLVIHCPNGLGMMRMVDMPMLDKNVSVAGLSVVGPDLMGLVLPKYIKPLRELGRYFDRSLVIFTTFFGLDKAVSLPPNFKLIGPSYEPPTPTSPKTLSPDLTQFLQKATSSKKPIVYVTFGSVLQLTQQFIKHLYEGLKKTDLAVIWSLRSGQLPEDNPHFFVRKWLPQRELLALEEVKAVITHCGWGGLTECVMCGKPMLAVPGFGDQPMNAKLLEERGIGLVLRPQPLGSFTKLLNQPGFTHQQLSIKLNRVINDNHFRENLVKMKALAGQAGGLPQACKLIKNAAEHGVGHLVDKEIEVIRNRSVKVLLIVVLVWLVMWVYGAVWGGCGHDHGEHGHGNQHSHSHGHEHEHEHIHKPTVSPFSKTSPNNKSSEL